MTITVRLAVLQQAIITPSAANIICSQIFMAHIKPAKLQKLIIHIKYFPKPLINPKETLWCIRWWSEGENLRRQSIERCCYFTTSAGRKMFGLIPVFTEHISRTGDTNKMWTALWKHSSWVPWVVKRSAAEHKFYSASCGGSGRWKPTFKVWLHSNTCEHGISWEMQSAF